MYYTVDLSGFILLTDVDDISLISKLSKLIPLDPKTHWKNEGFYIPKNMGEMKSPLKIKVQYEWVPMVLTLSFAKFVLGDFYWDVHCT